MEMPPVMLSKEAAGGAAHQSGLENGTKTTVVGLPNELGNRLAEVWACVNKPEVYKKGISSVRDPRRK